MGFRISAVAVLAALAILGVAGGAAASNSATYNDPAGDSASAADLTRVDDSSDDAGNITFQLAYGNRPTGLTEDDEVHIWVDSDANPSTGDQYGYEYVIALAKGAAVLKHATTSGLEDTPSTPFTAAADGTSARVNRSELGNTARFDFYGATITRLDNSIDYAPDGDNVFIYSLTAPRPSRILVVFSPKTPKAGKTFTAVVPLVQLEDGGAMVGGTLACNGTLNGKAIRATVKPLRCAWKLPKSAKGKRFSFTVVVDNNGSKATFGPWKFKVLR
jgi:hypothetical protein